MARSKTMYTIAETAAELDLPEDEIRRAIRDRVIAAESVGGRWVITDDQLDVLREELADDAEGEDE